MPIPKDQVLYDKVKKEADKVYSKPSAYKSGFIVKKYKELGGEYLDDKKPRKLKRWFKEDWKSNTGHYGYTSKSSVYRPTKRISKKTGGLRDHDVALFLCDQLGLVAGSPGSGLALAGHQQPFHH